MKNYGLLTLYYYNIYMPFLHPLGGVTGQRISRNYSILHSCMPRQA